MRDAQRIANGAAKPVCAVIDPPDEERLANCACRSLWHVILRDL
jgi:hypothetical protein